MVTNETYCFLPYAFLATATLATGADFFEFLTTRMGDFFLLAMRDNVMRFARAGKCLI
jgi:hypothetical protein